MKRLIIIVFSLLIALYGLGCVKAHFETGPKTSIEGAGRMDSNDAIMGFDGAGAE